MRVMRRWKRCFSAPPEAMSSSAIIGALRLYERELRAETRVIILIPRPAVTAGVRDPKPLPD